MIEKLRSLIVILLTLGVLPGCQSPGDFDPSVPVEPSIVEREKCGLGSAEYNRLMALEYKAFDADVFGGWRVIDYRKNCAEVASWAIFEYIDTERRTELSAAQLRLLHWHAGQTIAKIDERKALAFFERSYEGNSAEPLSDWDLYVSGTIAFINHDKPGLTAAFDALAQRPVTLEQRQRRQAYVDANPNIKTPLGFVTEPENLPALRGLIKCFGEPYRIAYGGRCEDENE